MSERDYDKQPVVVEYKVRVFVYEPVNKSSVQSLCDNGEIQEQIFDLLTDGITDNLVGCGLDEISFEIKE